MPSRCELLSRPLELLPCALVCAISELLLPLENDFFDSKPSNSLPVAFFAAVIFAVAKLEGNHFVPANRAQHLALHRSVFDMRLPDSHLLSLRYQKHITERNTGSVLLGKIFHFQDIVGLNFVLFTSCFYDGVHKSSLKMH